MSLHAASPDVVRFPPRLWAVSAASSALDALLSAGTIDGRQHAAGLAYAALRRRFETAGRSARRGGAGLSLPEAKWFALKRRHAALLRPRRPGAVAARPLGARR